MVPVVLFMQQFDENRYLMGHINMAQRMWVRTGRVQLTGPLVELKGRRGSWFEDLSPSDLSVLERGGGPYKQRNVRVVELPPLLPNIGTVTRLCVKDQVKIHIITAYAPNDSQHVRVIIVFVFSVIFHWNYSANHPFQHCKYA
ncbi:hypothetical protein XENORESO_001485 [Xenotaenia resolanae]|uniref:Uncharacterized protein n=1 Tax=Xenotaenia resolanae TaxID=208358 RepID=A0ABV0VNY6_9TELE